MSLQSDKDGFLTGSAAKIDKGAVEKLMSVMAAVRGDVSAIRKALLGQLSKAASPSRGNVNSQAFRKISSPGAAASTVQRDSRGRFVGKAATASPNSATASPAAIQKQQVAVVSATTKLAAAIEKERDARGKFTGKDGSGDETASISKKAGFWARLKDSFSGGMSGSGAGIGDAAAQIDPGVAAAGEVASAVAPIARLGGGMFRFFRGDKQEKAEEKVAKKVHLPWYKKIHKALEYLDTRSVGGVASDAGGGILSTVGGAPLGGGLLSFARKGIGRVIGGIGRVFGGIGRFAKAMPLLAKISTPIATMFSAFKSFNTTSEEFASRMGVELDGSLLQELGVRFAGTLGDLGNTLTFGLAGKFGEFISPAIGDATDYIKKKWDDTTKLWSDLTTDIGAKWTGITDYIGEKLGKAKATVVNAYNEGKEKVSNGAQTVKDGATGAYRGAVDAASRGIESGVNLYKGGKNAISGLLEAGKGYNVVKGADGSVIKQEGARNWRNNNPGNMEYGDFAKKHGAIGGDGRFAIFPSYEAGRGAKEDLIFGGKNYKDLSLTDAISRYAPPSENNTANYQRSVLGAVGGANKKMSEYSPDERSKIMDAMEKVEGYKAGKVSVLSPATTAAVTASAKIPGAQSVSAAPSPGTQSIPPMAPTPIASTADKGKGDGKVNVYGDNIFGQNLSDRSAAQVVTGGIGFIQGGRA